jgi:hypothetical protein
MCKSKDQKGFTLLLAMLILSILLSAALGVSDIILKGNKFSLIAQESQKAFFAADKGIDCALFYHLAYDRVPGASPAWTHGPFPRNDTPNYNDDINMNLVTCDGDHLDSLPWSITTTPTSGTTRFTLNFMDGSCAEVTVLNENNGVDSTITSNGYNTCDSSDPSRTLRVIEVTTNL